MISSLLWKRLWHGSAIDALAALVALPLLLLVSSCSDPVVSPGGTPSEDALFDGAYDPQSGTIAFSLVSPTGEILPSLQLVASGVQLDSEGLLHARVAIQNLGSESVLGPDRVFVSHFLPPSVRPVNAICPRVSPDSLPPDSTLYDPFPFACSFDHRGTYGDDGLLAAGESSVPVEWIFAGTGGESFAFRAQLFMDAVPAEGLISGIVFEDTNENGLYDGTERGIPGVGVGLVVGDHVRLETTDTRGQYHFVVGDAGLYRLSVSVPAGAHATGPTELQVLIVRNANGMLSNFMEGNFGLVTTPPWSDLRIEGVVYLDLNRNGIREQDESGVPGVTIGASGAECLILVVAQGHTDAEGRYVIEGRDVPCPLPWVVDRQPKAGLVPTTPPRVELLQRPPEGSVFQVDFGVAPEDSVPRPVNVSITGVVFVDWNGNGVQEDGEDGVPGVEIQLLSPCDIVLAATTDETGHYLFEPEVVGMCPVNGVWQSRPEFLSHTTPNPVELHLPTVPGNHLLRVDFGLGPER